MPPVLLTVTQRVKIFLILFFTICHDLGPSGRYTSYCNLSSVCGSVCPLTTPSFTDLWAPNSAWMSRLVTEKSSRGPFPWKPLYFLGNQEILSQLRYQVEGDDILWAGLFLSYKIACCIKTKSLESLPLKSLEFLPSLVIQFPGKSLPRWHYTIPHYNFNGMGWWHRTSAPPRHNFNGM